MKRIIKSTTFNRIKEKKKYIYIYIYIYIYYQNILKLKIMFNPKRSFSLQSLYRRKSKRNKEWQLIVLPFTYLYISYSSKIFYKILKIHIYCLP